MRIICAFPVGGIADLYARIIGQRLAGFRALASTDELEA
jgi:tripartite-type tricarboxylate transporter receptor subunit TctC